MQDYLKVICSASEWDTTPITTSVIAARVGVSPSSASEMIRKLSGLGLIHHERYGAVELTDTGRLLALRVIRRHRLVETYLVAELGYTWDEVHDEAEVLEHAISNLMLSRIDARLGYPTRDPHGDPIPTEDGRMVVPDAARLTELEPGDTGTIARISDDDPGMLRYFTEHLLSLDATLTVLARRPYGAGIQIEVEGRTMDLGDQAAAAIWVTLVTPT
ncbi:metal-dependent transcriptional regulator [Nakamurella silvestris]|nr:metal-dependent transcriptional regulator [Nakamurella silvestris]